jgi:catechol 2,3-dioxygenase-like lactoylglutathione lyase family enzyme
MAIKKILAQLNCSDLSSSQAWYEKFFGRTPDACPMAGLAEWHQQNAGGLQLFESKDHAGHGTLTLIVDGLKDERIRLENAGLSPGDVEPATSISLVRLRDPDGNLIVLAQPGSS